MKVQLDRPLGRHGVTALTAAFAAGALIEDLVQPTVRIGVGSYDRGPEAVIVAVLAAVVALVAARDRLGVVAPVAAVALLGLASLTAEAWVLNSTSLYLLVMLQCGLAGYLATSPRQRLGLGVIIAAGTLAVVQQPDTTVSSWPPVISFMAIAWGVGLLIRRPVQRAQSAEERAAALLQEQELAAQRAVQEERRRIARELHDVIAHSVSVMTVQTGAVRRRLSPAQSLERESLMAVERTGREALAEMRRLVGLLKEDDAAAYAPQPGMQTLDSLLESVRAAGLPVELAVDGAPRELPPGVDLAAFRVVQEALTNTLKHAGPAHASVRIHWLDEELQIEVANDGRAVSTAEGTGHGHAGMRERLRLYGGRLESGPKAGGGYAVRAFVPIGAGA